MLVLPRTGWRGRWTGSGGVAPQAKEPYLNRGTTTNGWGAFLENKTRAWIHGFVRGDLVGKRPVEGSGLPPKIGKAIAMHMKTKHIGAFLFSLLVGVVAAQAPEEGPVAGVFSTTQLINAQTTNLLETKGFEFKIQHRFGAFNLDESAYKQFLGLDLPANIRFGFGYAFSDRLNVEIGRTKVNKTYDLGLKYLVLQQTKNNAAPVSIALYGNMALGSDEFPAIGEHHYYADGTTPFQYEFAHRLSYNTQVIVSRKISHKLSVQAAAVFIYHNLVAAESDNHTMALPIGGRFRTGLQSSVLVEYAAVFNNHAPNHLNPMSLAYEVGTAGHVFQMVLSSSSSMLEQNEYTTPSVDYLEGEILLGFNIKRMFWSKKKQMENENHYP